MPEPTTPTPHEVQAYKLMLACRLHYATPGEASEYVAAMRKLLPPGTEPPHELLELPQPTRSAEPDEAERLYHRALLAWAHPHAVDRVREQAHRFLVQHLEQRGASPDLVEAVCDEALLVLNEWRTRLAAAEEGGGRAK